MPFMAFKLHMNACAVHSTWGLGLRAKNRAPKLTKNVSSKRLNIMYLPFSYCPELVSMNIDSAHLQANERAFLVKLEQSV